jgi:hypothetical protein
VARGKIRKHCGFSGDSTTDLHQSSQSKGQNWQTPNSC